MRHGFLQDLADALENNLGSPSSAHAMEQAAWEVLDRLQDPDHARLRDAAEKADALARLWTARALEKSEVPLALYAGQVQSFALLARAALLREIPLSVQAVLGHKNTVGFLEALEESDSTLSKLADRVGLALAQVQREVNRLADHDLVRTVKDGRDRWVRLTSLGHRALTWSRERAAAASRLRMPSTEFAGSLASSSPETQMGAAMDLYSQWVAMEAQTQRLEAIASELKGAADGLTGGVQELHEVAHSQKVAAGASPSAGEARGRGKRRSNRVVGKER